MCEINKKRGLQRIDPCMRHFIETLNSLRVHTLACCCGHKKYPMTIICSTNLGVVFDLVSGVQINRVRRFYKRDKQGYYFIPETLKPKNIKRRTT